MVHAINSNMRNYTFILGLTCMDYDRPNLDHNFRLLKVIPNHIVEANTNSSQIQIYSYVAKLRNVNFTALK